MAGDAIDAVVRGKRNMPAFTHLPDDEVAGVILYMRRKFAGEPAPDLTAEDVRVQRR